MMLLILLFLLSSIQLSSAFPQPIVDRQAAPQPVNLLPTKVAGATYSDYTWTVTTTTMTVDPAATSVKIRASTISSPATTAAAVTATLMGVVTDGTFHWPPPEITATVGQRIRITLVNSLPIQTQYVRNVPKYTQEKVTLHFHGLDQENGYGSMDGPESVTQCGVGDSTFVYDFPVTRAGTYWIHSHDPGQYPKGLRSVLVIPDGTSYAADYTVTLSDWYPDFWRTEELYNEKEGTSFYDSCGNGVEDLGPAFAATFNDYVPGIHTDKKRFYRILPGLNRFRFINFSAFSPFFVKFEGQRVKVIEIDGVLVDAPGDTEGFVVMPGQRVSVTFNAVAATPATYRIVAAIDTRFVPNMPGFENCILPNADQSITAYTWGCFWYGDDETSEPTNCLAPNLPDWPMLTFQPQAPLGNSAALNSTLNVPWHWDMQTPAAYPWDFNEKVLTPSAGQPGYTSDDLLYPSKENVHFLSIKYYTGATASNAGYGTLNFDTGSDDLWVSPAIPGFMRATQSSNTNINDASSYGADSNTIVVQNTGDVVWLVIDTVSGDHPMHLHGQQFQLLYRGFEDVASIAAYRAAIDAYNSGADPTNSWGAFRSAVALQAPTKPMTRDTILAKKNQFMILAFKADNPGVWALHCHNDFHASTGMMKQVVVDPTALRQKLGTWDISNSAISYNKPSSPFDQVIVDALLRNVQQCNPDSTLPDDATWH
ncbi:multicopper oxidase [Stipitochalara longipes BDJ]|nr:multicopper oxidase [Stipitochalara longipes BDJ]